MASDQTKTILLEAAKKVFSENSFDGATVKDVADRAGVNVSLVSYHFGGKAGLYRACIEEFATHRVETMRRILSPPESLEEMRLKLKLFAEEMMAVHRDEPDLCKILHRDFVTMNDEVADVFVKVFFHLSEAFRKFILEASRRGFVRSFEQADIAASVVFGSLIHLVESDPKRVLFGLPSIHNPQFAPLFIQTWVEIALHGLIQTTSAEGPKPAEIELNSKKMKKQN